MSAAWQRFSPRKQCRRTIQPIFSPTLLLWLMVQSGSSSSVAGFVFDFERLKCSIGLGVPTETLLVPFNIYVLIQCNGRKNTVPREFEASSPPRKLTVDVFAGPDADCDGEQTYNHTELLITPPTNHLESPPQQHDLQLNDARGKGYVCMYVYTYICMYMCVCVCVRVYMIYDICIQRLMIYYLCMYVLCMDGWMYVSMYVCL
jgi:hypothetical protein